MNVYLPYLFYALGLSVAIAWPFFRVWLNDKQPFLWREAIVKVLGAGIALLMLPNFNELYSSIGSMALNVAFASGFAAAFAGHEVVRMATSVKTNYEAR